MKRKKRRLITLILIAILTTITVASSVNANASSFSLNKKKVILKIGETFQLKLNGTEPAQYVWKSSNKSVVTVSSTGKLRAKKAGSAIVSVGNHGETLKCKIIVKTIDVSKYLKPNFKSNKSFNQMRRILGMNKIVQDSGYNSARDRAYSYTGSVKNSYISNVCLGEEYEDSPGCFSIYIKDASCSCGGVSAGTKKENVKKLLIRSGWKYWQYNLYEKGDWELLLHYKNGRVSSMMIQIKS